MDENVIFNNEPPADTPQATQDQAAPEDIPQTDAGTGGEPPAESPPEDTPPAEEIQQGPPPPMGGGLIKKILIGLGIFIVLIIIIILILPKNKKVSDVSLTWWGLWEDSRTMDSLISDFEKQNPHTKITYVKQDPAQYLDKLITRIKNGSGPDIFTYHNTWVPMLTSILKPMSQDVISPDDFQKNYYPVEQKDLVANGAIYGIPLGVDSIAMFVNSDIIKAAGESAPKNWDEFVSVSQKLTVKDGTKIKTAGAGMGVYGNITHAPDIISVILLQQGVDPRKLAASSGDVNTALTFYTKFASGDQNVWDSTLDDSVLAFAKGNLGIYFGYSWDIFTIQQLNKNLKFQVYPVPSLYGKNTTVASYWVEGVSSSSQNQNAAMQFMHYLTQTDTLQKFYTEAAKTRLFGEPYPRSDMANLLKDNSLIYPFVSQMATADSSFFASDTHDGTSGVNTRSNTYLENAVNSIQNDNSSADTAISTLTDGITQVLQQAGYGQ